MRYVTKRRHLIYAVVYGILANLFMGLYGLDMAYHLYLFMGFFCCVGVFVLLLPEESHNE